jgi:hypothetical protein
MNPSFPYQMGELALPFSQNSQKGVRGDLIGMQDSSPRKRFMRIGTSRKLDNWNH